MKPNYVFFYKNNEAIDDLLLHSPFCYDKPIRVRRNNEGALIEYKHFILRCYLMNKPSLVMRGVKTWQVLVEDELYDEMDNEFINYSLLPMITPYELLGGRIVKVDKYAL